MPDKAEWVAFSCKSGYKVTYSTDEISISAVVQDPKGIENVRRAILLGRDKIKEGLSKNADHSKVNLPPISISH